MILLQYAHETEHKERALKLKKELLIAANKKELLRFVMICMCVSVYVWVCGVV